jgi:TolB-like protein/Flp pilus assembly protein TadD
MDERRLTFGSYSLDLAQGTLQRQGLPVSIGYRAFQILTVLASHAGEIVPKAELIEAAWPGTVVEENNLAVQVGALRKLLGSAPDGGEWIVNIPRIGYRFAASERPPAQPPAAEPELGPSIAVLPFTSLSDDPEQAYFADGLVEDLIARLARLHWLFVASRNASFSLKGRIPSPSEVGAELRVRYVLEGSVRRSGPRLRVAAQLSDAAARRQVWAANYDVELADFFELQDRISEAVVAAIEPRLWAAEHQRIAVRAPESLDAWGCVMKAMPYFWTWSSPQEIATAQSWLVRALAIDPLYPRANSLYGWTLAAGVQLGLAEDCALALERAHELSRTAVRAAPEDPMTHFATGYVRMVARETDGAIASLDEALTLNPSLATAHMMLASTYGYAGRADEGMHHLKLADQLSPRDFSQAAVHATAGLCHFVAGRYPEALASARRALDLSPQFLTALRTYASCCGLVDDLATGREALHRAHELHPGLSLDWVDRWHPIVRPEHREIYLEGLRRSGLT